MRTKKICMLGAFAVGKTSLVKQFISSIFSDKYQTTIGVKISKKMVHIQQQTIQLMIWDIEGTDAFTQLKTSYLKGASGIILVIDGTRHASFDEANQIKASANNALGNIPIVTLVNKSDLVNQWVFDDSNFEAIQREGWNPVRTSAKTGENVEQSFTELVKLILNVESE